MPATVVAIPSIQISTRLEVAASDSIGDHLMVTCPECTDRFIAPADAGGALVDCPVCPWSGTVANPDN